MDLPASTPSAPAEQGAGAGDEHPEAAEALVASDFPPPPAVDTAAAKLLGLGAHIDALTKGLGRILFSAERQEVCVHSLPAACGGVHSLRCLCGRRPGTAMAEAAARADIRAGDSVRDPVLPGTLPQGCAGRTVSFREWQQPN